MQTQTTQPLPRYSQYTVRLMAPCVWRTLASATRALWPTFGNHRIYQLQPAETESAPNVIRLLSAKTECPPKVPIYPHSAPKPKPKIGRPLNPGFKITYFSMANILKPCILYCPTADDLLLNLQCNLPLMRVPSAIAKFLVGLDLGFLAWLCLFVFV